MNFVGHIHIASRCLERYGYPSLSASSELKASEGAEPPGSPQVESGPPTALRYFLGTALPDFAAIGRFQLRNESPDSAVRSGIAFHHSTDGAFHGSDWFVAQSKALGADLRSQGVNRGAARACGHVGIELLLDGNLLTQDSGLALQAQQVLEAANHPRLYLNNLVEEPHLRPWARHLERIGSWELPTDYDNPTAVAERLHRILSHRPRLAFENDQIPMVADALARASETLVPGIDNLVQTVSDEVVAELA